MFTRENAQEIVNQLGGAGRLKAMVGVEYFIFSCEKQSVGFKFEGNPEMEYVNITLNYKDLYDMTFYYKDKVITELKDIYNDQLIDVFEDTTKLYLSLQ